MAILPEKRTSSACINTYSHAITVTGKRSITYTYDATENKKEVTVGNSIAGKTITTTYINGFVYESKYQNKIKQFMENKREVWQRGPIENIPSLLQPVVHALLQAMEELHDMMIDFPEKLLWERPAGVASPAFHLQHLTGMLNRLFTYARKESLTVDQLHALKIEGNEQDTSSSMKELIELFDKQVDASINELSKVNVDTLPEIRTIGRKLIPTTLIGLYVHAAEHTMRHIGQLLVTVRVLANR